MHPVVWCHHEARGAGCRSAAGSGEICFSRVLSYREAARPTGVEEALRNHKQVIVIEEHAPQGGLAPQTKQIAWDIGAQCTLHTFTLRDEFIHNYGSHDDLLAAHGLSLDRIMATVS